MTHEKAKYRGIGDPHIMLHDNASRKSMHDALRELIRVSFVFFSYTLGHQFTIQTNNQVQGLNKSTDNSVMVPVNINLNNCLNVPNLTLMLPS